MTLRGYKSADIYIIELDIDMNAITNLNRVVKDKNYAKYRCDEAYVVKIYHKFSEHEINLIKSDFDPEFVYITGQKVKVEKFDQNINEVCTTGIHFYLTKEAAYYHDLDNKFITSKFNFKFKMWSDDGELNKICNYYNGKLNGLYEAFHRDGKQFIKCHYNDDIKIGLYEEWYNNGQLCIRYNYENDKVTGYEKYYKDGRPYVMSLKCSQNS